MLRIKRKQGKLLWPQNTNDQTAENFTNIRLSTVKPSRERNVIT
jgi:hypothetical protein